MLVSCWVQQQEEYLRIWNAKSLSSSCPFIYFISHSGGMLLLEFSSSSGRGIFLFFFFYVQYTAAVADGRSHQRDTSHRDWVREGKSKGTWEQSEAAASFPGLQLYGLRGEAKLDHKTDCTAVAAILSSPSPPPYGVACNTSLSQPPHIHNTQSQQQGPPISSPFLL